jgi:hypothetical protein
MNADTKPAGRLADTFEEFCGSPDQIIMPPGYRDSALALVDAIFSMQARYEGARRVVHNYATWAGLTETPGLPKDPAQSDRHDLRDLYGRLSDVATPDLIELVFKNRSRSARADRLKAELVVEAAERLIDADLSSRHDVSLRPGTASFRRQKVVWSSIHGLGPVTFEYFRLLCGAESSKPDIMILGWLESIIGRRPSWREALDLVAALTDELAARWNVRVSMRGIDHTIWRHQSGRGLDPDAPVGWIPEGRGEPPACESLRPIRSGQRP